MATCATCAAIWGEAGPPADFEDYVARYPALAHGAKRQFRQGTHGGFLQLMTRLPGPLH